MYGTWCRITVFDLSILEEQFELSRAVLQGRGKFPPTDERFDFFSRSFGSFEVSLHFEAGLAILDANCECIAVIFERHRPFIVNRGVMLHAIDQGNDIWVVHRSQLDWFGVGASLGARAAVDRGRLSTVPRPD
jgi:hypothetical protein